MIALSEGLEPASEIHMDQRICFHRKQDKFQYSYFFTFTLSGNCARKQTFVNFFKHSRENKTEE
jgi:hypothetical protein